MSLYTSIFIHPVDEKFAPTLEQIKAITDYMEIVGVDSVSISPQIPLIVKLRRKFFPRQFERYPVVPDLVYERNVSIEKVLEHLQHPQAFRSHFMPKYEGWCRRLVDEMEASIPRDIASGFDGFPYLPWDTGFSIGPWHICDYETGKVIAQGRFAISKSANGYPRDKKIYLQEFNKLESIRDLMVFLDRACSTRWTSTMEMS